MKRGTLPESLKSMWGHVPPVPPQVPTSVASPILRLLTFATLEISLSLCISSTLPSVCFPLPVGGTEGNVPN